MADKRGSTRKPGVNQQVTEDDVNAQLERARLIEQLLERSSPQIPAKQERFLLSEADGQAMSGCSKGNERSFLQWMLSKTHRLLTVKGEDRDGYVWLLEAQRGMLLNSEPRTPSESMILSQALCTHELAVEVGRKIMLSDDPSIQSRLAGRYVQLAELACKQAECVQRLRGEGQQRVTVGNLNVEDGGRAVVGHVHATQGNEDSKS